MIRLSLMDFIATGVITFPCNDSAPDPSKRSNTLWDNSERIQFCCNIYCYLGILLGALTVWKAAALFLLSKDG